MAPLASQRERRACCSYERLCGSADDGLCYSQGPGIDDRGGEVVRTPHLNVSGKPFIKSLLGANGSTPGRLLMKAMLGPMVSKKESIIVQKSILFRIADSGMLWKMGTKRGT